MARFRYCVPLPPCSWRLIHNIALPSQDPWTAPVWPFDETRQIRCLCLVMHLQRFPLLPLFILSLSNTFVASPLPLTSQCGCFSPSLVSYSDSGIRSSLYLLLLFPPKITPLISSYLLFSAVSTLACSFCHCVP